MLEGKCPSSRGRKKKHVMDPSYFQYTPERLNIKKTERERKSDFFPRPAESLRVEHGLNENCFFLCCTAKAPVGIARTLDARHNVGNSELGQRDSPDSFIKK